MSIGSNIKKYRTLSNLTQKDLAEHLNYTYQAISRWENDEADPSIDALKQMAHIFNCSIDELLGNEVDKKIETPKEEITYKCDHCGKIMHQPNEYVRTFKKIETIEDGEHKIRNKEVILCNGCYEVTELERKYKENQKSNEKKIKYISGKSRRIHSFIWPSILALGLIIASIVCFTNNLTTNGWIILVSSVFGYTFLATMILNNTFVTETWLDIFELGFVKMPGIIFELSFDGLKALIVAKLFLWALGIALAILAALLATVLCALLSLFVYPYAIYKNIKG